ncbi:MAG: hypothetical protein CSA21_07490 [Deltaproteobacteria bacterium]|nr:MAG: hypothetical protein CSA21_07490 [Deltaproteobacteria bacterium]
MTVHDLDILQLGARGYCCAQIIIKMALRLWDEENPMLVRASGALCQGITGDGVCGAFTGAACLLGCYAAKGDDQEKEDERLQLMLTELWQWFTEHCAQRHSGHACKDIVPDGQIHPEVCGGLVSACYNKALELLAINGFDPEYPNDR